MRRTDLRDEAAQPLLAGVAVRAFVPDLPSRNRASAWLTADWVTPSRFDGPVIASAMPAGRVGTADDVANAVLYLATTSFVTGTVLAVDGGLPLSSL
jgi:NAD(P)-dependent dehydrogenase (short-subunit alcohol dehydrogenase family)